MKKTILILGIAFLAGSAQAQFRGGSLNSAGGMNGSHSTISNSGATGSTSQGNVGATNPGEFVPSTFESYQQAVATGQEELDARPLRLADVARILQAQKKSEIQKPALTAEQDDEGNVIISGKQHGLARATSPTTKD
jgi:hypothetical protein